MPACVIKSASGAMMLSYHPSGFIALLVAGCAVAQDPTYEGAQTCAGTVPTSCRFITSTSDCQHQLGCQWYGPSSGTAPSPPAPPAGDGEAAALPLPAVQAARPQRGASPDAVPLPGSDCALALGIDPSSVAPDGQVRGAACAPAQGAVPVQRHDPPRASLLPAHALRSLRPAT